MTTTTIGVIIETGRSEMYQIALFWVNVLMALFNFTVFFIGGSVPNAFVGVFNLLTAGLCFYFSRKEI